MKFLLTLILCFSLFKINAQEWQWLWNFDVSSEEHSQKITHDPSGNCIVTGTFHSVPLMTGDFSFEDNTNRNHFVVKLDSAGVVQWALQPIGKTEPWVFSPNLRDLACDQFGNIFIAGTFVDTMSFGNCMVTTLDAQGDKALSFIAKLYPDGSCAWIKKAESIESNRLETIEVTDGGEVYVGGTFKNEIDYDDASFQSSVEDVQVAYIIKLDSEGNTQWLKELSSPEIRVDIQEIHVDKEENIYVAARFYDSITIAGVEVISDYRKNMLLAKLDKDASYLWHQSIVCPNENDNCFLLVHDLESYEGKMVFTGHFHEGRLMIGDSLYSSFNPKSNFIGLVDESEFSWSTTAGAVPSQLGLGPNLSIDHNGGIHYISTFQYSFELDGQNYVSNGGTDIIMIDFDQEGQVTWAQSFGELLDDNAFGISINGFGSAFINGNFRDSLKVGDLSLVSDSSVDAFVGKLNYANITSAVKNPEIALSYKLWPNPASEAIYISAERKMLKTDVYNHQGQKMATFSGLPSTILIDNWSSGLYYLSVYDEQFRQYHIEFIVR